MTRAVTNERALWEENGMSEYTCRHELGNFRVNYLLFFDSSAEFAALILIQPVPDGSTPTASLLPSGAF
jgi:hypothetical protein